MARKVRPLAQEAWDQLLVVAAGYLTVCDGDLKLAMSRAIAAHAELIASVKKGEITAEIPGGRVVLFVPEEGGLALALEPTPRKASPDSAEDAYSDLGPPEVTLEVLERESTYGPSGPRSDAGPHDDEDWSNQG